MSGGSSSWGAWAADLAFRAKAVALNVTRTELIVLEATNEEAWGPHGSAMSGDDGCGLELKGPVDEEETGSTGALHQRALLAVPLPFAEIARLAENPDKYNRIMVSRDLHAAIAAGLIRCTDEVATARFNCSLSLV